MDQKEIRDGLEKARLARAPKTIHDLAMSMASFIAAIDASSVDVAAYIEQRLQPIIPMMRADIRVERAVERMRDDDRQLRAGRPDPARNEASGSPQLQPPQESQDGSGEDSQDHDSPRR